VKDAADDATIIDTASAGLMTGQQSFDHRPGCVVEPEKRLE
jgi:hypothetical protein